MKKITEGLLLLAVCLFMIAGIYMAPNYVLVFSFFIGLSFIIRDRITLFIKVCLLFLMFIPTDIYILPSGLEGIFGKFTFVTCFAVIYTALFYLFFDNKQKHRILNSRIQLIFLAFALYGCLITLLFRGFVSIPLILNNFVVPFLLFKLLYEKLEVKSVEGIVNFYVIISVISALYGIGEWILQFNYLYDFVFNSFPWYINKTSMGSYRIFSTIGHPLQVSVVYLSTVAMIPFSKFKNNIVINCIPLLAIVFTGSRTGLALSILFVLIRVAYQVFLAQENRMDKSLIKKIIFFAVPLILMAAAYKIGVFDYTLSRFNDGADSTAVRTTSVNYFLSNYRSYFIGKGMKASYDIAKSFFGANHYFENCWISLFIDLGLIGFALYLASIIAITLMNILRFKLVEKSFYMFLFIITFIAAISSFDSISVLCNLNYIFFIFMAVINTIIFQDVSRLKKSENTTEILNGGTYEINSILSAAVSRNT